MNMNIIVFDLRDFLGHSWNANPSLKDHLFRRFSIRMHASITTQWFVHKLKYLFDPPSPKMGDTPQGKSSATETRHARTI